MIYNTLGEYVNVCYYPGATMEKLAKKIWYYTRSHEVDTIYIMAGVNNMTKRDRGTGRCTVIHSSAGELSDHIMGLYSDLTKYCYIYCNIRQVILCTLTGMSLSRYNRVSTQHDGQWIIDWGVKLVNDKIIEKNAAHGFYTPCLHRAVHLTQQRPYRHRAMYNRLNDGLHPTTKTLARWGCSLVRSMRLNCHL